MNTDKIMEALEDAYQHFLAMWQMASGPLTKADADMKIKRNRDALAELDKAPKVLTDEPVAWMWRQMMYGYMGGWHQKCERYNPLDNAHVNRHDIEDLTPLYLAPAAGLTVEEAMEAMRPFASELMERQVRARLTAAQEAKTNPLQRTQ